MSRLSKGGSLTWRTVTDGRRDARGGERKGKRLEKGGFKEEQRRRRKGGSMRRFLVENDKRKWRQAGREVRDVG